MLELRNQALGQLETVHHFRIMGVRHDVHAPNTLPPVSSGDKIKVTGACVATAA